MADVNVPICLRQSDGKLIAIDANCESVELPVCMNASTGVLWVYHADCDGVGESDGWYQVCTAAGGGLQITIPDDCCGVPCISCPGEVVPCNQYEIQIPAYTGSPSHPAVVAVVTRDDVCHWTGDADPPTSCAVSCVLHYSGGWKIVVAWSYYVAPYNWEWRLLYTLPSFDCLAVNYYTSAVGTARCVACTYNWFSGYSDAQITITPLCI